MWHKYLYRCDSTCGNTLKPLQCQTRGKYVGGKKLWNICKTNTMFVLSDNDIDMFVF